MTKLLGAAILLASLGAVYLYETSSIAVGSFRIFHWPAMVLTGAGPLGLVLLCCDWLAIREALQLLLGRSPRACRRAHEEEAGILCKLSERFYSQGARALDGIATDRLSPYFKSTLDRLALRIPTEDVRNLLERDRDLGEARLTQSINLISLGVRLAPSVGMLGTILGMVQLLSSLQDPSHIGSHMSLALLTTFYGLFFSLVFWTPMQQRLERLLDIELFGYDQLIHWLELLENRKPAQYFSGALGGGTERSLETPAAPPA